LGIFLQCARQNLYSPGSLRGERISAGLEPARPRAGGLTVGRRLKERRFSNRRTNDGKTSIRCQRFRSTESFSQRNQKPAVGKPPLLEGANNVRGRYLIL
jgi:hypothetical protein